MTFNGYNVSVRGTSHIARDMDCQDFSGITCAGNYCAAAVSDGHGGERHFRSAAGAKAAVDISLEAVKEFVSNENDFLPNIAGNYKSILRQLSGCISARWADAVLAHFDSNPITDSEKDIFEKYYAAGSAGAETNFTAVYGATLIIAVITPSYAFVIQTGDGACAVIPQRGNCFIPEETIDENLFLGYTTSLCDSNSLDNFRFYYSSEIPKAIILSTDGVVDSYSKEDFLKFNNAVYDLFVQNYDGAFNDLSDWLPRLSERGSKDDMSVAGIYCVI